MTTAVEDFLAAYDPQVRDLALQTRDLIRQIMPDAIEQVSVGHKTISYSRGSRMADIIYYIAPLKDSVNLGFFRGTELADPHALLKGTGKLLRHVKLRRPEDLQWAELHDLIRSAAE